MTTDTNTAAALPVCPICGKSKGFAKGFGRIITTHFRVDNNNDVFYHEGAIDQPRHSLDGLNVSRCLVQTKNWWQRCQSMLSDFGDLGDALKEADERNRPWDNRRPEDDIIDEYLQSVDGYRLLACDLADCREKLDTDIRAAILGKRGRVILAAMRSKPKKK